MGGGVCYTFLKSARQGLFGYVWVKGGGVGDHIFAEFKEEVGHFQDFRLSVQKTQVTNWGLGENRAYFQHIVATTKNHAKYNDVF